MAPFNKRQIGYIQAIAGRQQHVTLKCGNHDGQISSDTAMNTDAEPQTLDTGRVEFDTNNPSELDAKSLLMYTWLLDQVELCFDSRADHNNDILQTADFANLSNSSRGTGPHKALQVFDAECKGAYRFQHSDSNGWRVSGDATAGGQLEQNDDSVKSIQRATPDGFLNSTTVKFRFTLPREIQGSGHATNNPMGQDHYEFRWVVWRNKRPTYRLGADSGEANLDQIRNGASFRNPGYDFFKGQTGRKRGLIGYTFHPDLDKDKYQNSDGTVENPTEKYSGARLNSAGNGWDEIHDAAILPDGEKKFTVDDIMTIPINKDDYVVMKDVRFFLGKQHGKSHFEDTLHWDWNDPIDTGDTNVLNSPTLNDKNYRWHMTLFGTSGGKSPCTLNHCVRWTTKMESG